MKKSDPELSQALLREASVLVNPAVTGSVVLADCAASQLLAAPLLRLRKNVRLPTAFSIASSMPQNSQEWPLCSRAMTVAASPVRSSASTAATRSDHTPERHVSTLVQHLERAFEKSHRTGSDIDKIGSCLVVQRPLVNTFEQHRHAEVVEHLVIRKV